MAKLDKETQEKIQELQNYEHTLQNLLMQKQAFQLELSEIENALSEIANSKDDVFKIIGNIMVKSDKNKIDKELRKKKDLITIRLKSINSQEADLMKHSEELKNEVMKKIK